MKNIIPELYNRLQNTVSQISKNYELIFVNDAVDHSLLELIKLSEQDLRVFTSISVEFWSSNCRYCGFRCSQKLL
jgi:hypothetical protein